MALKDGRCPNCGSIVHLDTASEKGHCLFCDAVFDNKAAFEIAANPQGVVFPNEPQPKYEGPNLNPSSTASMSAQRQKQSQKQQAPKPVQAPSGYVMKEPVKIPSIVVPLKLKLQIFGGLAAIILIVAAIVVPIILNRDSVRAKLLAEMNTVAPFTVTVAEDVAIAGTGNDQLLIATSEDVTEADMVTLFKAFCEKRAQIQNNSSTEFSSIYGQVTVKLVTPQGGWLIERPSDQAALDSGSAIKTLNK